MSPDDCFSGPSAPDDGFGCSTVFDADCFTGEVARFRRRLVACFARLAFGIAWSFAVVQDHRQRITGFDDVQWRRVIALLHHHRSEITAFHGSQCGTRTAYL